MASIRQRILDVGDLRMCVQEAGDPDGDLVVLLHGFPELAYSWRHQMGPLADMGHRVVAPDLRGFGSTTARKRSPERLDAFDIEHLSADVVGLIDALQRDDAILIGHDWGAELAWKTTLMHPDRVRAVAGLSVPFVPRAPAPPLRVLREHLGEDFYMVWFQRPGEAD